MKGNLHICLYNTGLTWNGFHYMLQSKDVSYHKRKQCNNNISPIFEQRSSKGLDTIFQQFTAYVGEFFFALRFA